MHTPYHLAPFHTANYKWILQHSFTTAAKATSENIDYRTPTRNHLVWQYTIYYTRILIR
jgi:hypothetical protein